MGNTSSDTKKFLFIKGYGNTIERNFKDKLIWASKLVYDGPIFKYICDLSCKYSKIFVIFKSDLDNIDFISEPNEKRLVASRIDYSDSYTFPIPQHDDYFNGVSDKFDKVSFFQRKDEIVWRGLERDGTLRIKFVNEINKYDFGIKLNIEFGNQTTRYNFLSKQDQAKCKYILVIDGYGWPGSINWTMLSGSVPIILSKNHVWYMDLLVPWKDYVPISEVNGTFPDLVYNISKIINEPNLAEYISINAPIKMTKILSMQKRYLELIFSTDKNYHEIINIIKLEIN
jgi:hypothetical protein